jgi:hypothetical protein
MLYVEFSVGAYRVSSLSIHAMQVQGERTLTGHDSTRPIPPHVCQVSSVSRLLAEY